VSPFHTAAAYTDWGRISVSLILSQIGRVFNSQKVKRTEVRAIHVIEAKGCAAKAWSLADSLRAIVIIASSFQSRPIVVWQTILFSIIRQVSVVFEGITWLSLVVRLKFLEEVPMAALQFSKNTLTLKGRETYGSGPFSPHFSVSSGYLSNWLASPTPPWTGGT